MPPQQETDRRTFLKSAAAVAAGFACRTTTIANAKERKAVSKFSPLTKVNVFSEDGELKEVIYGRVEDCRIPPYNDTYSFVGGVFGELLKKHPSSPLFSEADPEWYKRAHDSVERVVAFLEGRGIVVHRPRLHTKDELANFALQSKMNINIYSRDSLDAIGNTLIETALKTPERLRDKYSVRYISMALLRKGNRVISCPQPLDTYNHNNDEEPLVEGGDVMIDHGHLYIGNSGYASNDLGYIWLKTNFPDFEVHQIKINTKQFHHQHLDCVMVMFTKWGLILEEAIPGGIAGLPGPLGKKKWIKMTFEETHNKLGNMIAINPEEVVMPEKAVRLRKEVEKLGIKVHAFPYSGVSNIGGSFRCNTCPLYRVG